MPPRLLTAKEVGELLQCSARTIARLTGTRQLARVRVGGQNRFLPADVDRYIESTRQPAVKAWGGKQ
jgi:excisionase family DNA binding protein